ncbi:MAG: DUF6689 family protein [Xanthomonadales bacterium]|nr:DUF6689 family protein [Xanthomonadales bacterium]
MNRSLIFSAWVGLTTLLTSTFAVAQVVVQVDENVVQAEISVAGLEADMTVTFDQVVGLSPQSIGISAGLVDPTNLSLLERLPDSSMGIAAAFPLKIVIEPPEEHGLSFTGTATVEIHTHALTLTTNSPFRLLKAPLGGDFEDITASLASGSVRSRGRVGGFSEFVIGVDTRLHDTVAAEKFAALAAELTNPSIDPAVQGELQTLLDSAEASFAAGEHLDAVAALDDFIDLVAEHQGTDIPNVWRATRDLDNVAGRLMASARTLIFSLRMANSFP